MVYVRLDRNWTHPDGTDHASGDTVDVDAATLAELEAEGVVAPADEQPRIRPVAAAAGAGEDWVGPGKTGEEWVGPGGADR